MIFITSLPSLLMLASSSGSEMGGTSVLAEREGAEGGDAERGVAGLEMIAWPLAANGHVVPPPLA